MELQFKATPKRTMGPRKGHLQRLIVPAVPVTQQSCPYDPKKPDPNALEMIRQRAEDEEDRDGGLYNF